MTETKPEHRLSPRAKAFVDYGPLGVFFVVYFFGARLAPLIGRIVGQDLSMPEGGELYWAVGSFLPVFAVAFVYSVWRERRVAPMLAVSGIAVGILGSLTLILQNKMFFYMKPTIVYAMFAATLWGGLLSGRNFLKSLFDGALQLPDDVWRVLTVRYAIFFLVLAVANEIAWRWLMHGCDFRAAETCSGEATWINIKLFGFTAANLVFAGLQGPLLMKYMENDPPEA